MENTENKKPFTQTWVFTIILIFVLAALCGFIGDLLGIRMGGAAVGAMIGAVIVFTRFRKK
jgi:membrane associated rhomboid family serine protease